MDNPNKRDSASYQKEIGMQGESDENECADTKEVQGDLCVEKRRDSNSDGNENGSTQSLTSSNDQTLMEIESPEEVKYKAFTFELLEKPKKAEEDQRPNPGLGNQFIFVDPMCIPDAILIVGYVQFEMISDCGVAQEEEEESDSSNSEEYSQNDSSSSEDEQDGANDQNVEECDPHLLSASGTHTSQPTKELKLELTKVLESLPSISMGSLVSKRSAGQERGNPIQKPPISQPAMGPGAESLQTLESLKIELPPISMGSHSSDSSGQASREPAQKAESSQLEFESSQTLGSLKIELPPISRGSLSSESSSGARDPVQRTPSSGPGLESIQPLESLKIELPSLSMGSLSSDSSTEQASRGLVQKTQTSQPVIGPGFESSETLDTQKMELPSISKGSLSSDRSTSKASKDHELMEIKESVLPRRQRHPTKKFEKMDVDKPDLVISEHESSELPSTSHLSEEGCVGFQYVDSKIGLSRIPISPPKRDLNLLTKLKNMEHAQGQKSEAGKIRMTTSPRKLAKLASLSPTKKRYASTPSMPNPGSKDPADLRKLLSEIKVMEPNLAKKELGIPQRQYSSTINLALPTLAEPGFDESLSPDISLYKFVRRIKNRFSASKQPKYNKIVNLLISLGEKNLEIERLREEVLESVSESEELTRNFKEVPMADFTDEMLDYIKGLKEESCTPEGAAAQETKYSPK